MRPLTPLVETLRYPGDKEVVSIRLGDGGLFGAFVDDEKIAESMSSRRLSEWALANGALRVRHDYDLREER